MGRIISNSFIYDLKEGALSKILKYIKADSTLQMELRKDSVNIYYRGGSLIKIKEHGQNQYKAYFDKNYVTSNASESVMVQCIDGINSIEATKNVIDVIPNIKQQMDFWMGVKKPDGGEREYHHIVAKENNSKNTGKKTDYFICDIEYSGELDKDKKFKFDMIGVKWPLIKGYRDSNQDLTLCILGMEYGNQGEHKIIDYVQDIYKFIGSQEKLENLKKEMKETFKIKSQLELIYPYEKNSIKFSDKIEVIFIFANQNLKNTTVVEELRELKENDVYNELSKVVEIKFAKGSFMGYGLYEDNMINIDELIK